MARVLAVVVAGVVVPGVIVPGVIVRAVIVRHPAGAEWFVVVVAAVRVARSIVRATAHRSWRWRIMHAIRIPPWGIQSIPCDQPSSPPTRSVKGQRISVIIDDGSSAFGSVT